MFEEEWDHRAGTVCLAWFRERGVSGGTLFNTS
jgi:hypothetical protein